jgi:hypothetical protein
VQYILQYLPRRAGRAVPIAPNLLRRTCYAEPVVRAGFLALWLASAIALVKPNTR